MNFQFLPKANIDKRITIPITQSNEDFFSALQKTFDKRWFWEPKTKYTYSVNYFIIRRTIANRNSFTISVDGLIVEENGKRLIQLKITIRDSSIFVFATFWYVINICLFLFLVVLSFAKGVSIFIGLFPLALIGMGYFVSTLMPQTYLDELIEQIRKAAK